MFRFPLNLKDYILFLFQSEYCIEELKRVQEEKREIEEECNALREKVVAMETELKNAKEHLDKLTEDYEVGLYLLLSYLLLYQGEVLTLKALTIFPHLKNSELHV